MRIVFPYIAQLHHIPHSLPIALELARRHPDSEVRVAYTGEKSLHFLQRLAQAYAPEAPLQYDRLRLDPADAWRVRRGGVPWKHLALLLNRDYFRHCDAIVTPERTSLLLRHLGVRTPRLIWTRHGAGDRAVGFAADITRFDFVLMAGRRIEQRLLAQGLIRPGDYASGIYAKFDWLHPDTPAPRLFDNDRPTVLYNPHFRGSLSSWPKFGMRVLEQFAQSRRYNLIFAPHIRLFDPPRRADHAAFAAFRELPHLHIDLGSERSIDMTYTRAADLYLGDVSSQVVEFIVRPRPCLFLDAHQVNWQDDPNYAFWKLGPVSTSVHHLEAQLDAAFAGQAKYRAAQERYVGETFELTPGSRSAARGADAIAAFMRRT